LERELVSCSSLRAKRSLHIVYNANRFRASFNARMFFAIPPRLSLACAWQTPASPSPEESFACVRFHHLRGRARSQAAEQAFQAVRPRDASSDCSTHLLISTTRTSSKQRTLTGVFQSMKYERLADE
jgi:hypothetical protein